MSLKPLTEGHDPRTIVVRKVGAIWRVWGGPAGSQVEDSATWRDAIDDAFRKARRLRRATAWFAESDAYHKAAAPRTDVLNGYVVELTPEQEAGAATLLQRAQAAVGDWGIDRPSAEVHLHLAASEP